MAAAPAPLTTTRMVSIFFPLSSRAFNNPAARNNGCPVLVIVHHGNIQFFFEPAFDFETFGCFNIFQVYSPESRGDHFNRFDEFIHVFRVEFDVKHVDVREYFKQ